MLTVEAVEKIFLDCLFNDDEIVNDKLVIEPIIVDDKPVIEPIIVDGIVSKFGFHPVRLESHRAEIAKLLFELPNQFFEDGGGGGYSFLKACIDNKGMQWGEHQNAEQLVALGIGLALCSYCLPREYWASLPGGVPYFVVKGKRA